PTEEPPAAAAAPAEETTEEEAEEAPARPKKRTVRKPKLGDAPVGTFSLLARGEEEAVLARGELVVGQTAHGVTQAVLLCLLLSCNSAQAWTGGLLLGAAAGGVGSFLLTGSGVSGGMANAINTGTVWGFAEGALLLASLPPQPGTAYAGVLAGTTLLGTAAGVALGGLLHPTGGQVAMASSGGVWTAVLVGLFTTPLLNSLQSGFWGMELAAANVGLLGFGYLASHLNYSRGRMFLIDVGGVLGGLVGAAAFVFAGLPASQAQLLGPLIGAGALGGLAGAVLLTSSIDAPSDEFVAQITLFPLVGPEGQTGLALGGRF
ncbi:MAG: hypothetical protein M3Y59_09345, partial [Myxococcota bacterium]|nr:hypothetical protein [Myxococcota bacterium]